ncbi:hypothetical protein Sste5346_010121 [Sporothrix stenoceras]|uniref:UBA domain-containing protein n=1 Tax=Sporothrix stenoceras TaxID=5173 RepID=A0ABR3YH98_9PEZI
MICNAPDSADAFRFYYSHAPKHRPQIAAGVKGLEVGRAALDDVVTSSVPKTTPDNKSKKRKEEPDDMTPLKKKPTALTVLSMANADGANTTTNQRQQQEKPMGKGKPSASIIAAYEIRKINTGMVTQDLAARVLFEAGFTSKRVEAVLYQSGYLDEFCWWDEVNSRSKFTVMMPFLD